LTIFVLDHKGRNEELLEARGADSELQAGSLISSLTMLVDILEAFVF
jgi:hypothetical protein